MKKLFSLLLALTLSLNMCIPAFAADDGLPFTDVNEGDWYYAAVQWAVEHDITQGISATEFGVNNTVTRAQTVTFLWRMAGSPEPMSVHGFDDVPEDAWFADAVNWAAEHGIAKGTSATTFSPDGELKREQAAAFLYREEQRRGGGFKGAWAFPLDYGDADAVSEYAYEPLCWLTMQAILQGADGLLAPQSLCNRAQLITILYRYVESLKAPEDPAFTEKDFPVLRETLESDETVRLRFYEDMPNVPYMDITQYYNQFYLLGTERTEGLTDARLGTHHILTNIAGCTAEFDTRTDAIVTDSLDAFVLLAYYLELALSGEIDENYPFLKESAETIPAYPTPLTLRLGDYGIDIRGGEDGLYLPLATLSDIYATTSLRYTVFSGEKLYTQDYQANLQPGSALALDDSFSTAVQKERGKDLADFTYRELCFNIDTFYGRPGQEFIHDELVGAGLDSILTESYPDVKEQLCSADFQEFYTGLNMLLHGLLFDGGHTGLTSRYMDDNPDELQDILVSLADKDYGKGLFDTVMRNMIAFLLSTLREELYNGDYYVEKGDTAMIRFDAFLVNSEAWKAFYAGTGEMPFEEDTLGTIYAGLQRAAKNPAIKNVVLDISCNGGGDSGAMLAIEWLMTGKGSIRFKNRLSGQVSISDCELDVNFDGKLD